MLETRSRKADAAAADAAEARDGGATSGQRHDAPPARPQTAEREEKAKRSASSIRDIVRRHSLVVGALAIALLAAIVAGVIWWMHARHFVTTDDAFIDTRAVPVSAQVAGAIVDVPVTDNQLVDAGTVLVRIDDRDYRAAQAQAKAQLDQAKATVANIEAQMEAQQAKINQAQGQVAQTQAALQFAQQEGSRAKDLLDRGAGTVQNAQQTASTLLQSEATYAAAKDAYSAAVKQTAVLQTQKQVAEGQVEQAEAAVQQAQTNLSRVAIRAPIEGRASKISAAKGAYAQPGQALMMFVPRNVWVTANFKETELTDMRPGQPVTISVDAYPGRSFRGHVDSIQAGSGAAFSLLPPENATGNYVKIVQRVPVKIVFDKPPDVYGPTLGGWITDNYSWHWIFFINVPIGILSLSLVQWLLVEPEALERERKQRLRGGLKVDYIGFILVALWLGALEIVLDKGQRDDWFHSNFIIGFTALSIVSALIFFPWEFTRKEPIVEVRLLFQRQFGTAFLMMLAVGAVLFGTTQILPQLMQVNFGYTAMLSGLALMPGGFAMLILMPIAGQVASRVQPKYLIAGGMLLIAIAMWHMTSLVPDANFGYFAWARVYQMLGLPFLFIPITSASYSDLRPEQTNQASALINVARNLGGSIGVSLAGTELAQSSQLHEARLTEHFFASSVPYQSAVHQMAGHLAAAGTSAADAQHQALGVLGTMVES